MLRTLHPLRRLALLVLAGTVLVAQACRSPKKAAPAPPGGQEAEEEWHPPAPEEVGDHDWVKLKSGEWLKGELKYLRDDGIEFESDELDTLFLDWEDIYAVRLAHVEDVVLTGDRVVTGTVLIDRKTAKVLTGGVETEYPRAEVISIVPNATSRREAWSGRFSLGLSLQEGNTEQTSVNTQAKARRRAPKSNVSADYIGNIGTVEGTTNVNNHRADGRWDLFIGRRWFVTPAQFTWFRDPFQNIGSQLVPSAGFGYHLVRQKDAEWTVSLNAGAQYTEFQSVSVGDPETESLFVALPGTVLDWEVTRNIDWTFNYSLQLPLPDTSGRVFHLTTTFSVDLVKDLDLDVTFQWDHVANPVAREDGTAPDSNDYRMSVGVGWDF